MLKVSLKGNIMKRMQLISKLQAANVALGTSVSALSNEQLATIWATLENRREKKREKAKVERIEANESRKAQAYRSAITARPMPSFAKLAPETAATAFAPKSETREEMIYRQALEASARIKARRLASEYEQRTGKTVLGE